MQNQTQEQIAKLNYSAANIPKGYYTSLTAIKNQTETKRGGKNLTLGFGHVRRRRTF